MGQLFTRLLSLSLAGSLVFLLLLAAEVLFSRFWTCRWRYYARLAVLAAFLLPLSLPKFPARVEQTLSPLPLWDISAQALGELGGALALPEPPPTSLFLKLLLGVWGLGVAVFALWRLLAWLRFCAAVRRVSVPAGDEEQRALAACRHELKLCAENYDSKKSQNLLAFVLGLFHRKSVRLLICPGVGAPALVGLFRPTVLLPQAGIPPEELRFILLHELTHLRRADIAYKLAAQAVNALHWFNPLAWLLSYQINSLCELSCDEAAVRGLDLAQRRRYGFALLAQIEHARRDLPHTVPAFSPAKQILLERLQIIMKVPKLTKRHAVLASLSALALCAAGATVSLALNPAANTPPSPSIAISQADNGTEIALFTSISPIPDTAEYRYVSLSFGGELEHTGTDIVAPAGTDVLAAADGVVVYAQSGGDSPYGNHVILEHKGGYRSLYGHCEKLLVKQGDTVTQGQAIATVGSSGYSTGPHCHFELRKGVDPVNAEEFVEIQNISPAK